MKDFVEQSKLRWHPSAGATITTEQIATGCLQRIATAMESLNRSWRSVQEQNVNLRLRITTLEHKNRALRGEITKLRKKAGV
jgi:hypothetical protein